MGYIIHCDLSGIQRQKSMYGLGLKNKQIDLR